MVNKRPVRNMVEQLWLSKQGRGCLDSFYTAQKVSPNRRVGSNEGDFYAILLIRWSKSEY